MQNRKPLRPWLVFQLISVMFAVGPLGGCLEEQAAKPPPSSPSPNVSNPYTSNPNGTNPNGTDPNGTNPGGTNPIAGAAAGSGRTGTGCGPADAEVVPNEPGLRECCRKLNPQMTACLGSACWGPGFAAKLKTHMAAGGQCTK